MRAAGGRRLPRRPARIGEKTARERPNLRVYARRDANRASRRVFRGYLARTHLTSVAQALSGCDPAVAMACNVIWWRR